MKHIIRLAALMLVWLCACQSALAAASGVSIRSVHPSETEPHMYFEVRVLDSSGRGVSVEGDDITLTAGNANVQLRTRDIPAGNIGHIIVVDTSKYYFGTDYIKEQNIRDIVAFYLANANASERVMFILAGNGRPEIVEYMPVSDARNYVPRISLKEGSSATRINEAIFTAFQYATDPTPGNPLFNSVFIVADPDIVSNQENDFSLNDSLRLCEENNMAFDVVIAVPYRQTYVEANKNRERMSNGFQAFSDFASELGGTYVEVPQSGNRSSAKVDTGSLHSALADKMSTSNYFTVDFSPLAGHMDEEDDDQYYFDGDTVRSVEVRAIYESDVCKIHVDLDTALLPPPPETPTPVPEITPTPAPTPVVYPGQDDTMAMQVVRSLHKLRYLDHLDYDAFDNECYLAYIEFCERNGIDPSDGIYQETYDLLLSGNAIPVPEITPEPTPTPGPTPLVSVGQADATAMQAIRSLHRLNYLETTSFEEFTNECFIAYIEFCDMNGLDPRDGIYEKGLNLLLSNDAVGLAPPTPEPTATPQPTVPPEGYTLNDADSDGSGGFIAQIQTILKNLNCYADGATAIVGRMDQATIDAINLYCATYNWRNDRADGVTKSICQEILTSGPNLVPRAEPEPTAKEKLMNFLMSDLPLFGLNLKMWMPALLCVVLVFLILVLLVLFSGGDKGNAGAKEKKGKKGKQQENPAPQVPSIRIHGQPVPTPGDQGGYVPPVPQPKPANPPHRRTPANDSFDTERTSTGYFGKPIELRVEYNGRVETSSAELMEGRAFVIGRKDDCDLILSSTDKELSRAHAQLVYQDDQVYLHDVSTYHKTTLNGMKVYGNDHNGKGLLVSNGDVIVAGSHRITVTW